MSKENTELDALLDYQADLDWAISQRDWKKATEIVFAVDEAGYQQEAKIMSRSVQRAYASSGNNPLDILGAQMKAMGI